MDISAISRVLTVTAGVTVCSVAASASALDMDTVAVDEPVQVAACEELRQELISDRRGIAGDEPPDLEIPARRTPLADDPALSEAGSQPGSARTVTDSGIPEEPGEATVFPPDAVRPAPTESPAILGGQTAIAGQFPSAVALTRRIADSWEWFCGGTLIHPSWVLTAAHCDVRAGDRAVVGLVDLRDMNDFSNGRRLHADKIFDITHVDCHDGYDKKTIDNDIAVVRLERPVEERIGTPVALAHPDDLFVQPGDTITAFGWGRTDISMSANELQYVEIDVVDQATCFENFAAHGETITPNMLCAGKTGQGICVGDSGSGALAGPGLSMVAGIASWGLDCGAVVPEGVFVRVSKFREWIRDATDL